MVQYRNYDAKEGGQHERRNQCVLCYNGSARRAGKDRQTAGRAGKTGKKVPVRREKGRADRGYHRGGAGAGLCGLLRGRRRTVLPCGLSRHVGAGHGRVPHVHPAGGEAVDGAGGRPAGRHDLQPDPRRAGDRQRVPVPAGRDRPAPLRLSGRRVRHTGARLGRPGDVVSAGRLAVHRKLVQGRGCNTPAGHG